MLSEVLFMSPTPDPDAAVKPLQLLLKDHPNSYKGDVTLPRHPVPLHIATSSYPSALCTSPRHLSISFSHSLSLCLSHSLTHNVFAALSNTINLLRRAGRLEEVPVILAAAEEKDRRSGSHAGTVDRTSYHMT